MDNDSRQFRDDVCADYCDSGTGQPDERRYCKNLSLNYCLSPANDGTGKVKHGQVILAL